MRSVTIRLSTLAASALAALWCFTAPVGAVVEPEPMSKPSAPSPTLIVASGAPARAYVHVEWQAVPARARGAWTQFQTNTGGTWRALWDRDTGIPLRIYGSGIPAPASVDDPDLAESYARQTLAEYMELLAPGARIEDFHVVSNHLGGDMRTVGMVQSHQGTPVIGGQVSFRFKADRLFVIGSEAAPLIHVPSNDDALDLEAVSEAAAGWIREHAGEAWQAGHDGPFILPIVSTGAVRYHSVYRVTVESRSPRGLWHVYMHASTGERIAREQQLRFGQGTVTYNVPTRFPNAARSIELARDASLTIDGVGGVSDGDGVVTWTGTAPVEINPAVIGPLVAVVSETGDVIMDVLTLEDGGTVEWQRSDSETIEAQISGFIHTRLIKEFSRTLNPNLEYLDQQLRVNVNIDDQCNAFYDGSSINFFRASQACQNTALLADVVYHEFGHALHRNSALPGVSDFAFALSEGLSDYLAAAYNDDPAMGRGFFFNDQPLRHLDPADNEYRWPDDIGEIHETGRIFGGAMWDLRKALVARYGAGPGVELANQLYYAALQRASSIPTTYVEILAADDDDGDLSNGTPNECDIDYTFGVLHGIGPDVLDFEAPDVLPGTGDGHVIRVPVPPTAARCPDQLLTAVRVEWQARDGDHDPGQLEPLTNSVELTDMGDEFVGRIPQQPDGTVVRYRIVLLQVNGGMSRFPSNRADTAYEFYVGELVELYCHDFESDPFEEDWQALVVIGDEALAAWEWGQPSGYAGDPQGAYQGMGIIGTDLGLGDEDGVYSPDRAIVAQMPAIDTSEYSDVRLQYRRWLTVEDALYDRAEILSNGRTVWTNYDTVGGSTHHLDTGWVFHDVPLNETVVGQSVQVGFALTSDPGLEFGGWNIDELCIVANPTSICGDGQVAPSEACDAGEANSDNRPDACRSNCRQAFCGDGVVDTGEECDDRNTDNADGCDNQCLLPEGEGGGCGCDLGRPTPTPYGALLLLGMAVIGLAYRRRRTLRTAHSR